MCVLISLHFFRVQYCWPFTRYICVRMASQRSTNTHTSSFCILEISFVAHSHAVLLHNSFWISGIFSCLFLFSTAYTFEIGRFFICRICIFLCGWKFYSDVYAYTHMKFHAVHWKITNAPAFACNFCSQMKKKTSRIRFFFLLYV